MRGKLFQSEQWAIHAWRRHLEGVFTADRIFHIENCAGLTADRFAVVHQDAAFLVDVDAQYRMLTLGNVFDPPALIAQTLDNRGQQGLQLF
ncbi:hypothetical protein D3C80_1515650 [compost metagenome]